MQQLLMIEDDTRLAQMVGEYLERSGFGVTHALDGKAGLALLQEPPAAGAADLLILDLMLPDMDGLEVCRRVRALPGEAGRVPVLMLTAKGDPMDRVIGLELGADDYLPKPFEPRELLARIRAILRRTKKVTHVSELSRGPFTLDRKNMKLFLDGSPLDLTTTEFKLLTTLMENDATVHTRADLLRDRWQRPPPRLAEKAAAAERPVDDRLGAGKAHRLHVALVLVQVEVDVGVIKRIIAALGGPHAIGGGARPGGRRLDILDVDERPGQLVDATGDGQVGQGLGLIGGIEGGGGRGVGRRHRHKRQVLHRLICAPDLDRLRHRCRQSWHGRRRDQFGHQPA